MPGTFVFRPKEANLVDEKGFYENNDPYCKVRVGMHSMKTKVAEHEGKNPHWDDSLVMKSRSWDHHAKIKVKESPGVHVANVIGKAKVNLDEVRAQGKVVKKYELHHLGNLVGDILLDIEYFKQ